MKKLFLISSALLVLTACGNEGTSENEEPTEETELTESVEETDEQDNEQENEKPEENRTEDSENQIDESSEEQKEVYISELTEFSDEERRAHHEKLADGPPEYVQEKVYEHLMLPGIHENTIRYQGRVNPGESVRISLINKEEPQEFIEDPEVTEDGYFTINLENYDLNVGQDIEVAITGGYPEQQNFVLTVNEAEEGMEDIRVKE